MPGILEHFTLAYIEAALWSTSDESDESGGEPLNANYTVNDIHPDTRAKIEADCRAFYEAHGALFTISNFKGRGSSGSYGSVSERAGHDFWLTRNNHGAGFWDGDWEEPAATTLDKAARAAGEFDFYVGDDGVIYGRFESAVDMCGETADGVKP